MKLCSYFNNKPQTIDSRTLNFSLQLASSYMSFAFAIGATKPERGQRGSSAPIYST